MASTNDSPMTAPPTLWRNRNFILLWCAYAVSAMGDHLSEMAILNTQGALEPQKDITTLSARMTFTFFLPFFLLGPFAGLLADRLPRRLLMIFADVVRCTLLFFFAALILWCEGLGSWGPFLPLLPVGVFAAVFSPARMALLPTLVRPVQLVRANGLISGMGIIATMAAAGLGGYLADNYHPIVAFRLDAATYAASAVLLLLLRPPRVPFHQQADAPHINVARRLADGFHYVHTHGRVMQLLTVAMLVWFCGALVNSALPAVVRDVYGGTFTTISLYRVYLGGGFVLGAILITTFGPALRSEVAIIWGLFGISIGMGVLTASAFLPLGTDTLRVLGAVGIVLGGMGAVTTMASFQTLLQRIVPDRLRGRVFGIKDLLAIGSLLLATGMLSWSGEIRIDRWVGLILAGVVVLTFTAGVAALRIRMRQFGWGAGITLSHGLNELLARFLWRLDFLNRSTVPRTGPVIITANHTSAPDPALLTVACFPRVPTFIIAAEYVRWPVVRTCVRLLNCIPVRRDGRDAAGTKAAIRFLREGRALGIFIEGGIGRPGQRRVPKDGVAMLALKTGAVVVPTYISGVIPCDGIVRGLLLRHRARLRYGSPVDLSEFARNRHDRATIRAASAKIYDAIFALAPEAVGSAVRTNASGEAPLSDHAKGPFPRTEASPPPREQHP